MMTSAAGQGVGERGSGQCESRVCHTDVVQLHATLTTEHSATGSGLRAGRRWAKRQAVEERRQRVRNRGAVWTEKRGGHERKRRSDQEGREEHAVSPTPEVPRQPPALSGLPPEGLIQRLT
ncbi:unnamed protein product [Pleuronectes platessa]|uniref:Uncharacterized protein n=1 Tax=Pleuronectes platessa TaxID=8262 RepID=A0A9N7U8K4_PLEPL|nr:unnamed protein product [Pleuronectes platessa]